MKSRYLFKCIIFIAGFVGIYLLCERILSEKWVYEAGKSEGETDRYEGFYEIPSNTLDYIVLGNSRSYYSINPILIYAQEGYTGYNLGSPGQSIEMSYYWLQEASKYQNPKYVFFDVSSLIGNGASETNVIKSLIHMKPSMLKIEAAYECKSSEMSVMQILSPMYTFHSRWEALEEDDFDISKRDSPFQGVYIDFNSHRYSDKDNANRTSYLLFDTDNSLTMQVGEISEYNAEIFNKIYTFCKEENMILIPVRCPSMYWYDEELQNIYNYK